MNERNNSTYYPLPLRTKKVQENQAFPDIHLGQDDLLVALPFYKPVYGFSHES